MVESANEQFTRYLGQFTNAAKKILIFRQDKSRKLPTDQDKIDKYTGDLVNSYNKFAGLVGLIFDAQSVEQKQRLTEEFRTGFKPKLIDALSILNLTVQIPDDFLQIDIKTIKQLTSNSDDNQSANKDEATGSQTVTKTNTITSVIQDNSSTDTNQTNQNTSNTITVTQPTQTIDTMPQTRADFLKEASGILNYKYDGDPLKLESFLADVELVKEMAEAEQRQFCLTFIKAKLDQKARECLPETVESIADIVTALRKELKLESSDVIEGRMLALRINKGDLTEFSQKAEKMAESYRRSLAAEGITKQKAKEISTKKTVELCRRLTQSETVKSIVQATKYENPSEVIATFITQTDISRKEKRESANNTQMHNRNPNNARGRSKFGQRGGFNRNNTGQNRDNNEQRDNRGRFQSNRGNRGGGQPRGNYRNNYQPQRAEQTIRLVAAPAPLQAQMAPQNVPQESLSEQFFRLAP